MKRIGSGRLISLIGILVMSAGLICNAFEIVSVRSFRMIVLVGIVMEVSTFIFVLQKSEF